MINILCKQTKAKDCYHAIGCTAIAREQTAVKNTDYA